VARHQQTGDRPDPVRLIICHADFPAAKPANSIGGVRGQWRHGRSRGGKSSKSRGPDLEMLPHMSKPLILPRKGASHESVSGTIVEETLQCDCPLPPSTGVVGLFCSPARPMKAERDAASLGCVWLGAATRMPAASRRLSLSTSLRVAAASCRRGWDCINCLDSTGEKEAMQVHGRVGELHGIRACPYPFCTKC
jgi:hypothetical protein